MPFPLRYSVFLLFLGTMLLGACTKQNSAPKSPVHLEPYNLLMGNPSNAKPDANKTDNYLIERVQYSMSYHAGRGTANWVSWYLNDEWIGDSFDRQNDFRSDPSLSPNWYMVTPSDYTGSGFDRGHLCPSADRALTPGDNSATFLMTNIIPQAPDVNRGAWADLEIYCRKLVGLGNELYIIAGQYGEGGVGDNNARTVYLADKKLIIPANVWKVILILPQGEDDIARVNNQTRVIAVDVPNKNSANAKKWYEYRVSVNDIEAATGLDLLNILPNTVESAVEKKVDSETIN